MRRNIILCLLLSGLMAGCLPAPFYQKAEGIPNNAWSYSFRPTFTFDITDTTVGYQPFFLIRHTQAYPFNNIWVWVYVTEPGDSVAKKARINIPLAETNGRWMGFGMGEIYEQRLPVSFGDSVHIRKAGTYTVSIAQNMRLNPLPDVLHVGIMVKKKEMGER